MSTLRAGTIANVAGTNSPDIVGGELSRARFNLNGTGTIALRDGFNIASITDNGVGDYSIAFTTTAPNNVYTITTAVRFGAATSPSSAAQSAVPTDTSVNGTRFMCVQGTGSAADYDIVCAAFVGDKP